MDVSLRAVLDEDLPLLHAYQCEPEALAMAAFPSRERAAFDAHWAKIRADAANVTRAVVVDGVVAGNVVSWPADGRRLVGYWIGQAYWGRGVATRALAALLDEVTERPLYAHVAAHNAASVRVLEKCGFVRTGSSTDDGGVEELHLELRA